MEGRRFVVFAAPDAGIGRLVARLHGGSPESATGYTMETPPEGAEFTDEHPRLHYGWKTTQEYRQRFGYLDYMCRRAPGEPYARDAGPALQLPDEVEERCGFMLFPYVSCTFAEAVTWGIHDDALEQLRAGAAHPAREEVLALARLAEVKKTVWGSLSDGERDWTIAQEVGAEQQLGSEPSERLREYLDLDERITSLSTLLREQEVAKIRRALATLDVWLLRT
jgi:hypothetical protein